MAEQKQQQEPKRSERKVRAVFAQFRDVRTNYAGQRSEVARTAFAGETVHLLPDEEKRLDALGALDGPESSAQAAVRRALNPSDNRREGAAAGIGGPAAGVVVSPPSVGQRPVGDASAVVGIQGNGEEAQPAALVGGSEPGQSVQGGGVGAGGDFDARRATLDEVAEWLRRERPNAPRTIEAAKGDPGAAETILEAERLVRDGDPRGNVEGPLQSLIDAEQQDAERREGADGDDE